ncbi:hypothetical protein EV421DRAFT_1907969 [Armillaria borealis]|uniref:Ribonuclease H1 N-terminal domain-containing protein n=1 Tax=Armillaria borealis TaxID=47425 RepID=A0AA39MJ77_9AGAR|nr:hypothetical protein EV421DRAFT_1907969 [Armillaria borealis]
MSDNVANSPYLTYETLELSTESSLSTDSLGDSLSLRLIIIDSEDEEPLRAPKTFWNPGRKCRPVGPKPFSEPVSPDNLRHSTSLPTPHTTLSKEHTCQPQATMRSEGHGDGFYVIMNGCIMGVFDLWNLTEGSYSGFPHQSYRKFLSLRHALAVWDKTWLNQEIGYPVDRHSNQSRYGPEWVRSQRHVTTKFYWVVVKGHIPGLYNTFDEAVLGVGEELCEVVVTRDEDIASRLFNDFTSSKEVVSV